MSRAICAAKTCYNSYTKTPLIKFFHFPKDEKRAQQWIKNCQREDLLSVPLDKLSKKHFLCSAHFEDELFLNPKFKTRFKQNVEPIPTIFFNNFTEFVPKSIQRKISSKILQNSDNSNEILKSTEDIVPEISGQCMSDSDEIKERVVCRLCTSDISSRDFKNIFSFCNKSLREMIEYLLPEKVFEDELPHYICSSCETKVIDCISTILFFEESYKRLKGIIDGDSYCTNFNLDKDLNREKLTVSNGNCDELENLDFCFENYSKPASEETVLESIDSVRNSNKSSMIKCSFCSAEFNSSCFAKRHVREVHKNVKSDSQKEGTLSKCSECDKVMSPSRLKSHMESHMPKENQCEYCGVRYKTKKRLESHLSTHEGDPFCSFCGKEFSSITQKRLHEKTHADDRGMLCDVCGRLFSEQRALDNHMKTHNKVCDFTCSVCSKSFKNESDLKLHLDSNPEKFLCSVCNKEFHLKARMQQHLLSHSGSGLFTCFCGASFNRIGNLTQHRKLKHEEMDENENVESFKCSICRRKVNSKLKLKWHMAKHNGDKKPYDCELCGKKFGSIVNYKNHMRTHTGERPFSCTFCSRTFTCKENVKQHEVIHKDVYPYHCTLCDRVFKRYHSLTIHRRVHSGERPFVCSICQKGFYQKHDLRKHLKVHNKTSKLTESADSLFSSEHEKMDEIPELAAVNIVSPITANSLQLFSVNNIPQLTLTSADLQLLNMPIVEIQPLMQLSSNV